MDENHPILFLDKLARVSPEVRAEIHRLVEERSAHVIEGTVIESTKSAKPLVISTNDTRFRVPGFPQDIHLLQQAARFFGGFCYGANRADCRESFAVLSTEPLTRMEVGEAILADHAKYCEQAHCKNNLNSQNLLIWES